MTDVICPNCTAKAGRPDKSGLFKRFKDDMCWLVCLTCEWQTEPSTHHADIGVPEEIELRDNWK